MILYFVFLLEELWFSIDIKSYTNLVEWSKAAKLCATDIKMNYKRI